MLNPLDNSVLSSRDTGTAAFQASLDTQNMVSYTPHVPPTPATTPPSLETHKSTTNHIANAMWFSSRADTAARQAAAARDGDSSRFDIFSSYQTTFSGHKTAFEEIGTELEKLNKHKKKHSSKISTIKFKLPAMITSFQSSLDAFKTEKNTDISSSQAVAEHDPNDSSVGPPVYSE
jgi:hypothetical protein